MNSNYETESKKIKLEESENVWGAVPHKNEGVD